MKTEQYQRERPDVVASQRSSAEEPIQERVSFNAPRRKLFRPAVWPFDFDLELGKDKSGDEYEKFKHHRASRGVSHSFTNDSIQNFHARTQGYAFSSLSLMVGLIPTEDEGWILSYVYDPKRDLSDVVILDAQDFTGEPIATIRLPVRVPFGFHGGWAPDRVTSVE